jgi:hypothetical protein
MNLKTTMDLAAKNAKSTKGGKGHTVADITPSLPYSITAHGLQLIVFVILAILVVNLYY